MSAIDPVRAAKLNRTLFAIVDGKQALTKQNSIIFLQAICAQEDRSACISRITTSPNGLKALQSAFRFDFNITFFNGLATDVLTYFSAPDIANIGGGSLLNDLIFAIVEPPVFWSPLKKAFHNGQLQERAQLSFSWLLFRLVSLPDPIQALPYRDYFSTPAVSDTLHASPIDGVKALANQIQDILDVVKAKVSVAGAERGPGGRHDNDFGDYHDIAILPTAEELLCKTRPFLRPASVLDDPETIPTRLVTHLDNQFRLLREDMLYEMRSELEIALGNAKGKFRGLIINGLTLLGIHSQTTSSDRDKPCKWCITLQCSADLPWFKDVKPVNRKSWLLDNKRVFRHKSSTALMVDGEIVAFTTVNRDEGLLAKSPPIIVLQLSGERSIIKALLKLKTAKSVRLIQIDTAIFSYEPVLSALQAKQGLPLSSDLLLWSPGTTPGMSSLPPDSLIDKLRRDPDQNIQFLLDTPKQIVLDQAQHASLLSGLTQEVSLIQGPPGTGKSFIGALLAKAIHDKTDGLILIVCYTNHALDQFLEDLLDIGIPETSLVRLGGKSTPRTSSLSLRNQPRTTKLSRTDWTEIDSLKAECVKAGEKMSSIFQMYKDFNIQNRDILDHIEFDDGDFFEAFQVPTPADGMQPVGRNGRAIGPDFLVDRWIRGWDAGMYKREDNVREGEGAKIWKMPAKERAKKLAQWKQDMLRDRVEAFHATAHEYDQILSQVERKFGESDGAMLRSKRIIGCTTTAAAMYREQLDTVMPDVLLVEEAGEILESHILTALSAKTKQLILIGDHKQLRPKVNHYLLTVEKGEGFDLNRSLFERLVLKGFPHATLCAQHRMRPEISDLVRQLTYPDLVDAAKTQNRPDLRGVRDNLVFINHSKQEGDDGHERKDSNEKASKHNAWEVKMILKILRYLNQQGYTSDDLVILTPYLGQLKKLQEALKKDNDPILSELDTAELVRAGLLTPSAARTQNKPIRIATIDNYQGEESKVVLVSLTRSNSEHDIGFMSSHERLTVLLSRARDALVMIGNSDTFMKAKKGSDKWVKLFELLRSGGHIYEGLPTKCERHPDKTALLSSPDEFDLHCPDGGCDELCTTMLKCGVHKCPLKCHQLKDHSGVLCKVSLSTQCPKGHPQRYSCHQGRPTNCRQCEADAKRAEKLKKEQLEREAKQDEVKRAYEERLAEIELQKEREKELLRDAMLNLARQEEIKKREKELLAAANLTTQAQASLVSAAGPSFASQPSTTQPPSSSPSITSTFSILQFFQRPSNPPSSPNTSNTPNPSSNDTKSPNSSTGPSPTNASSNTNSPNKSAPKPPIPPPSFPSAARDRWETQKRRGASNDAIDAIMAMTGLEDVKEQVLRIKDKVDTSKRQNTDLTGERFHVSMLGNPGTGKTTVARHYGQFLASVRVVSGSMFVETTGARLANDGVNGIESLLKQMLTNGGGTLFVDEAYQLTATHAASAGRQVLDYLLAEIENLIGKIVFIFAGYNKEMEKFFEHNPGLTSRVPYTLKFKDYSDPELMGLLQGMFVKTWGAQMKVEDGIGGLYGRILVSRLGRGRGSPGFGNARALENVFAKVRERQSVRLTRERASGGTPDDFWMTKEDIIGPDPADVMIKSEAWKKLQGMIGLGAVKKTVTSMFAMLEANYQRELLEKRPNLVTLNRVFLGSPGTGKTTVAKLYGQILVDLGMLSNGEVVMKNPSDFIGGYIGHSEMQTKAILNTTLGKVLVIDEAYMLGNGGSNGAGNTDSFKTAVIDTLVAEIQAEPGADRCVLLLGYKKEMEEMFENVNPGLSRRFAIDNPFMFNDFTDSELLQALEYKMREQDLSATDDAKTVAMEVLSRQRNRPNFGNIGDVENLLGTAKTRYQGRQSSLPAAQRSPDAPFEPQDFDPDFDRSKNAATNLATLFEDVVGCEKVVTKMSQYQNMARNMKAAGKDPREDIPTSFVFKGPPGTGKTTTARKIGKVYFDMGFLSSTEVVECSASDLVGMYVGHTGPKTRKMFEKALGRVLFIDEAYRLGEGRFASEAMDELVGLLTQETFRGKLIVILAGYDQEMNQLMSVNPGLSSRFPEEVVFENISPERCLEILKRKLKKKSIAIDALDNPSSSAYVRLLDLIEDLSRLPSWGNARDIETISKQMVTHVFSTIPTPGSQPPVGGPDQILTMSDQDAVDCVSRMLAERRERAFNLPQQSRSGGSTGHAYANAPPSNPPPPSSGVGSSAPAKPPNQSNAKSGKKSKGQDAPAAAGTTTDGRDPGVTDEVWRELQIDKALGEAARQKAEAEMRVMEQEVLETSERNKAAEAAKKAAEEEAALLEKRISQESSMRMLEEARAEAKVRAEAERAEFKKRLEEARERVKKENEEHARRVAELEKKRQEEERKQREEARVQSRIRQLGVCIRGFQWIKQTSGYRCAGGQHFLGNDVLDIK